MDLCKSTDLAPLGRYQGRVDSSLPNPPGFDVGDGSACVVELTTTDGYKVSLWVTAKTASDGAKTDSLYRATRGSGETDEGSIAGLGDRAEASSTRTVRADGHYSLYDVAARQANVVVWVSLAVVAATDIAVATLRPAAIALARSTLAAVTTR